MGTLRIQIRILIYSIPYINRIQKCINNQHIHFNVYDVFYSQYSQQHVSAGISAIFRVIFILHEYNSDHSVGGQITGRNVLMRIL